MTQDDPKAPLTIAGFQHLIEATFGQKDQVRGLGGTFMWFTEEVGELARALKKSPPDPVNLNVEFGDVLAWLCTLASMAGIDMEAAARRYAQGCPRCVQIPCACGESTRFQQLQKPPSSASPSRTP